MERHDEERKRGRKKTKGCTEEMEGDRNTEWKKRRKEKNNPSGDTRDGGKKKGKRIRK